MQVALEARDAARKIASTEVSARDYIARRSGSTRSESPRDAKQKRRKVQCEIASTAREDPARCSAHEIASTVQAAAREMSATALALEEQRCTRDCECAGSQEETQENSRACDPGKPKSDRPKRSASIELESLFFCTLCSNIFRPLLQLSPLNIGPMLLPACSGSSRRVATMNAPPQQRGPDRTVVDNK